MGKARTRATARAHKAAKPVKKKPVKAVPAPPPAPRGGKALDGFKRELAMQELRRLNPQMWLQANRLIKLLEIQQRLPTQQFPPGCCFLHANTVTTSSFCVKRVAEINLDSFQVTVEIHGDEHLEEGLVLMPLEVIEWFGFPAKAVPTGVHFAGFTESEQAPNPVLEEGLAGQPAAEPA